MHNSGKCHTYPGIINLTTWLLLPTGDEVHALYESKLQRKDVGHFPLTKCLYPQYVPRLPGMSP